MEGGAGESASVSVVGSESASRRESLASEEEVQEIKESNAQAQCKDFAVDGIHFFYQSSDGQKVFLHPVSMRCLLEEYGSYLALPRTIKGKVLDLEICMQTEELRKRHKALEHVPLSADIRFVEVDVVGMLSKGTLEKMRSKLEERTKLRRQRAKHQAQAQLRAQHKERREREKKNPPPPLTPAPPLRSLVMTRPSMRPRHALRFRPRHRCRPRWPMILQVTILPPYKP